MRTTTSSQITAWALGLSLLASAGLAAEREAALGAQGELYMVRAGAYGELFPGSSDFAAANPVLALDIMRAGEPVQRILVPGTGSGELEATPAVLFEDDSNSVFLVWENRVNQIHSTFKLAGFDQKEWSKPIEVSGSLFSQKTSPQLAITRDGYRDRDEEGLPVTRHRTILHLTWNEENQTDVWDTFYTPIVLQDGVYLGRNPVYRLNGYDSAEVPGGAAVNSPELFRAVNIQGGRDGRTVVVTFASGLTRRLVSVEVDVLPEEIGFLAGGARATIIELGARHYPSNLPALAKGASAKVLELGSAFHPEVAQAIADQVRTLIASGPSDGLGFLADEARATIIELGARLSGRGLRGITHAAAASSTSNIRIVEIAKPTETAVIDQTSPSHLIQFRVASNRTAPRVGAGAVKLFASEEGDDVLVSWAQGDRVLYRMSQGSAWSDIREIKLSANVDLKRAYEILDQRVRNR
jgi:hypothetical protein